MTSLGIIRLFAWSHHVALVGGCRGAGSNIAVGRRHINLTQIQACIKFLIPPWGGGFVKSVGEEYQVVKRERNIMAVGKK